MAGVPERPLLAGERHVVVHHHGDELVEAHAGASAEAALGLAGVPLEDVIDVEAPVPACGEVAEEEVVLESLDDPAHGPGDLPGRVVFIR